MLTKGKGRGRAPSLLLTLLLGCAMVVGLGAAVPAFALTLSGTVASDVNGNGILDVMDAPLGGISVTVQPAGGGVAATTTTTASGTYSFPGLAANNYTVTVGSVTGLLNGTPASVTVALNADLNNANFLFVVPGLIGGRVVSDLNGNGIAEPTEPGIPGVAVDLNSINNLGQSVLVTTVITSADGTFFFPLQPAGTYVVVAHPTAGAVATGANAGSSGTATVVDANTFRIVLNGAQAASGLRFSERTPQTVGISGFVLDTTSKPVANVVVELRDAAQNLLDMTLTDATGQYFFGSVAAGATYVIRVVPPPGLTIKSVQPNPPATAVGTSGIQIVNFSPGTSYANNNFILASSAVVSPVTPGSANAISGKVINDLNGDGVFSAGEPGLAGATLTLVATTGVSFGTTVTSTTGDFTFVNLPAGDYILTRTNPTGFVSTGVQPGVGGTSLTLDTIRISVTGSSSLFSGQLFLARSSTPVPPSGTGIISGSVLQDTNLNGIIDFADTPLAGLQVMLQTQLGGFIAQTFTDVNGAYAFTGLAAGTYRIVEVVPPNFVALTAVAGAGGVALNATTIQVTNLGGVSSGNNFLNRATVVSPTVGIISGSVLRDVNGNGVIDAGDAPAQGVTVELFTLLNALVGLTTTDVNGAYAFANIPPGFYRVVEVVPSGLVGVAAFAGTNGAVISPTTIQVTAAAGVNSGNNNFLLSSPVAVTATISGTVLQDTNGNGTINAGDTAMQGVVVQLRNQFGSFLANFVTDANGAYAFSGLPAGTYQVVQLVPANFAAIAAFAGPGGLVLNTTTIQVTVSGNVSGNNNFLDRSTVVSPTVGIISGTVLLDTNGNGFVDAGDTRLQGVVVELFTQLPAFVGLTTTDVNGAYAFTNIPPGSYQVVQVVPAGLTPVSPTVLSVSAIAGVNQGNNNFLDRSTAPPTGTNTISGFAIRDTNLNGIADNELGLAGMLIVLRNASNTPIASAVTDATGAFSFSGLASGTYTLTATPPSGLINTNAIPGQGGTRLSAASISVSTTLGTTSYPGQLFLAGP